MTGRTFWPALIVAYFAFQTLYRTLLGGALGLDDAQMFLDAQEFRWGYGPQLPLYAWLQRCVFLALGDTLFSLALLKNALLCTMALTFYALFRTRFDDWSAGLAAASLILLPQIAWESQRALTHSVLASLCAVLCLVTLWWIARRPTTLGFICLGLVLTAGGLAKYNFALMPVAAMVALITIPELRSAFRDRRLLISFAIPLILLARPYLWILRHQEMAFDSATKFNVAEHTSLLMQSGEALLAVASATMNFLLLPFVVVGLLWMIFRQGLAPDPDNLERLMRRLVVFGLGLLLVGAVLAGATQIKDRWLQPILIFSGPVAVLWLLPRISEVGKRRLAQVYGIIAALVALGLPIHFFRGDADVAAPFAELGPQIQMRLPSPETHIITHQWIAGNLLYAVPGLRLINEAYPKSRPDPEGHYVLIWKGDDAAEGIRRLADHFPDRPGWTLDNHEVLAAPYRFDGDELMTLSMARIVRSR